MKVVYFGGYFHLLLAAFLAVKASEIKPKVTRIVLVGATGDLARKYLWQGIFNLYLEQKDTGVELKVYAAARLEPIAGLKQVQDMTRSVLKCTKTLEDSCETRKTQFIGHVAYHKLKTEDDFKSFCEDLKKEGTGNQKEHGRIFYLSVPPSAYGAISKNIHLQCRPPSDDKAFLRVVFEKPFGEDLQSAKKLASTLGEYFKEEEMYRIDHYLGKTGVQQILRFRSENLEQFEPLWNHEHIDRVEIALKEKDDCRGRTNFYNQYGVIRDVMQNHMTELMTMVAMDMPGSISNDSEVSRNKIKLLRDIIPPHQFSTVLGQYREYRSHCAEDKCGKSSSTPTFAAVKMYINNARWHGVPFIFISGKQMDERSAYVKVIFKNNKHSVKSLEGGKCNVDQIVFHIQGGTLGKPTVLISKNLPGIASFLDWKLLVGGSKVLYNCHEDNFRIFTPLTNQDAYSVLINSVFNGWHDIFIGTADLLASWEVWTPLLNEVNLAAPRLYDSNSLDVLDFTTRGKVIEYTNNMDVVKDDTTTQLQFRGVPLITGSLENVIRSLAASIKQHALQTIAQQGIFHMALSGGSSPLPVLKQLAFYSPTFPWHVTHVWIVDERCVPVTDSASNFQSIYQSLLKHVPIPFVNIHAMPIDLHNGVCNPRDNGPGLYKKHLKTFLTNEKMDFVLLGVGADGHTASIFPKSPTSMKSSELVTFSESTEMIPTGRRMTMTLDFLNQARSIGVLIHGEKKAGIVQQLSDGESSSKLPISKLQPLNGELVWYIDEEAIRKEEAPALHSEL